MQLNTRQWANVSVGFAPAIAGEPNGFLDNSDVTLAWDDGTRTLTLTGTYTIYSDGIRYDLSGGTFQIADTEGGHFIFYDETGTLDEILSFDPSLINQYCFVTYVYWDAVNSEAVPWAINELHGCKMSSDTHSYLHNTAGAAYVDGMEPTGITASDNPNGVDDDQCQMTSTVGEMRDEDIIQTIVARAALTDNITVMWKEGTEASPVWRKKDTDSFPVSALGVSDRVQFNEVSGGDWVLTEVGSNNDFVLAHLFAMPGTNTSSGELIAFVGQAEYATRTLARDAAYVEALALVLDGLPGPEFIQVATFIVKTNSTYGNTPKAAFVLTDAGEEFIDWRVQRGLGATA